MISHEKFGAQNGLEIERHYTSSTDPVAKILRNSLGQTSYSTTGLL